MTAYGAPVRLPIRPLPGRVTSPTLTRPQPCAFQPDRSTLLPLLFGPGSIHAAHTADEYIDIAELNAAVSSYVAIARQLLARA